MSLGQVPETLRTLLEHYSPTGSEAHAVQALLARMEALGFRQAFADQAGSAVGIMGSGSRQIVLLGHIDTVPGEIPLRVAPGAGGEPAIYGRGAVDAKGPLAAFVDAVASVGDLPGWQYVVIGAVDEEGDSRGARHALPSYQPEYAIIGEPSGWERLTLGYKGSAWAEVTLRQPLAHTARQEASASEAAFAAWETLRQWVAAFNMGRERAFDQLQVTLRGLASGGDGFTEWASLQVGARLPLDYPVQAWYDQLEAIFPQAVQPAGYPMPAYRGEKNTPLVRAFLRTIRAAGGAPGFVLKTGTADLNLVAPAWGCPALAYGPGDASLDHTPDEHLSLGEYDWAVQVLAGVLKTLAG